EIIMEQGLKLVLINVNGLNIPTKRRRMLSKIEKQKMDVVCLQEVHIKKQDESLLQYKKLGKLYTTLAEEKESGRIILIVELFVGRKSILLVGIYAPNKNQSEFYKNTHDKIIELGNQNVCVIGDYNTIVDIQKDYTSEQKCKFKRNILPKAFFEMSEELNLMDLWRTLNPGVTQFTFYSNPHKSWSRIDMQLEDKKAIKPQAQMAYQENSTKI
uniref:Endonuclease/exonuclease/phosphatase domain-containing protein n=1 Tax=Naja naja TaxID=35670 RepID=A0A8C6XAH7_NAJNA